MAECKVVILVLLLVAETSQCEVHFLEAEEGGNFTVQWLSPTTMDLSELHMNCRLLTEPLKEVLHVLGGKEAPEAQDAQFSGRVWFDTEALRQGQVWLLLTRLTALDSGKYRCEMAANYDSDRGGWGFIATEYFELKVTPKIVHPRTTPHAENLMTAGRAQTALRHDPLTAAVVIPLVLIVAPCFMITVMFFMRQFYR